MGPNQVYEVVYQGRWMKREPPVAGQHDLGPDEPGWQRKVERSRQPQCWIELSQARGCAALASDGNDSQVEDQRLTDARTRLVLKHKSLADFQLAWPGAKKMSRPNGIEYSGRREHIQFLGAPNFNLPGLFQLDNHHCVPKNANVKPYFCTGVFQLSMKRKEEEGKRDCKTRPGLT